MKRQGWFNLLIVVSLFFNALAAVGLHWEKGKRKELKERMVENDMKLGRSINGAFFDIRAIVEFYEEELGVDREGVYEYIKMKREKKVEDEIDRRKEEWKDGVDSLE